MQLLASLAPENEVPDCEVIMGERYVAAKLSDSRTLYIETTATGPGNVGAPVNVGVRPDLRLEQVADTVAAFSDMMVAAIKKARPSKASIEFGLEIGVEAGQLTAILVKGSGKTTLSIHIEWSSQPGDE